MKIDVVSPWYPDDASVFLGVFVQQQVKALRAAGVAIAVEVPQIFPAPPGPVPENVFAAMEARASNDPDAVYPRRDAATWIPCPVPARSGFAGRTQAFRSGISAKRRHQPIEGDLVHAHLGVPTAAAVLAIEDRPVVVTEHQSTLDLVLDEPPAREQYRQAIDEAAAFFVVAGHLRDRLVSVFGEEVRERIGVMPNIVELSDIPFRARSHQCLERWIYVGALVAHKGVHLLIDALLHHRREHNPTATLTLVGDGPESRWIQEQVRAAGASDAVELLGALPHGDLAKHLEAADVMVHLSPAETFGIASLEGLGAGLPVVSLANGGADHTWGSIADTCGCILPTRSSAAQVSDAVAELADRHAELDLAAARAHVESTYSSESVARSLLDVYQELLR